MRLVPQPRPRGSDRSCRCVLPRRLTAARDDGDRHIVLAVPGRGALAARLTRRPRLQRAPGRPTAGASRHRGATRDRLRHDGHRRSLAGSRAVWSASGRLAVVNAAGTRTTLLDQRGRVLVHVPGAAAGWSATGSRLLLPARARSWSPTRSGRGAAGARARPEVLVALRCRVHARRCTCPLLPPSAPASWRFPWRAARRVCCPGTASGHVTGAMHSRERSRRRSSAGCRAWRS